MNYFKTKLIIVIFFVFITLHDAYGMQRKEAVEDLRNNRGVPRPKNEEQASMSQAPVEVKNTKAEGEKQHKDKKDEKPLPYVILKKEKVCVEKLEELGFSTNENYLDHYLNLFKELNEKEEFDQYDNRLSTYTIKCMIDPYSIKRPSELNDSEDQTDRESLLKYHRLDDDEDEMMHPLITESPLEISSSEEDKKKGKQQNEVNPAFKDSKIVRSPAFYIPNNTSTTEDLKVLFTCDLLLTVYDLFPIENATQFCKIEKNNPYHGKPNEIDACAEELHEANLDFDHGLDNYAYLIRKIDNDEIEIEHVQTEDQNKKAEDQIMDKNIKIKIISKTAPFSALQENYIEFLFNKITKIIASNTNLGDTVYWCKCKECEDDLRNAGFDERIEGFENYEVIRIQYGFDCDKLDTQTRKEYCEYLSGVTILRNDMSDGTFLWCAKRFNTSKNEHIEEYTPLSLQHV